MVERRKMLLNAILNWVNKTLDKTTTEKDSLFLKEKFAVIEKKNETLLFIKYLNEEFSDSPETIIMILSILFEQVPTQMILSELYKILNRNDLDFFLLNFIRRQLEHCLFLNNDFHIDYDTHKKVQMNFVNGLKEMINLDLQEIPIIERDKDTVVVLTNQFLGDLHAPTHLVSEFCHELQKTCNKKVYLIICVENTSVKNILSIWMKKDYFVTNYKEEYLGGFVYDYKGTDIPCYQALLTQDNIQEARNLVKTIYDIKPYFAFYIGSFAVFPDLIKDFTTLASMKITAGYAVSSAQIMINYLNDKKDETKEIEETFNKENRYHTPFGAYGIIKEAKNVFSRQEFNIPDDGFILTVVGNRLNEEIKEDFIQMLTKVVEKNNNVYIALIGETDPKDMILNVEKLKNNIICIGFQRELTDAISLCDLFVNPKRQGGGGGALMSLGAGRPIVTIKNCDIANVAGDAFVCENYEEMKNLIIKYSEDKEFYSQKSKAVKDRKKELTVDYGEEIFKLVGQIEKYIVEQ